jgi:hypothetical protein
MTTAICGYPPVVWRSAISRIGSPDGGTCTAPVTVASEIIRPAVRVASNPPDNR